MKTFGKFIRENSIDNKIKEIATLMAENNIDADVFLRTWYERNEPELFVYLTEGDVWNGIKQGAQAAWTGIKGAAQQFGQGMQQGVQNYQRSSNGPMQQYQLAVKTLNGLVDYMKKDPSLANSYNHVIDQIAGILKNLQTLQSQIPDNQQGQWKSQTHPMAYQMGQGVSQPEQPQQNTGGYEG